MIVNVWIKAVTMVTGHLMAGRYIPHFDLNSLRVNVTKNQRNRRHISKFNFAHTLSIGRPKSHTYDRDVRLLKFSLVWEKST